MKKSTLFCLFVLSVVGLLAGCGGFTGTKTATITGTVLDIDNNPVRDARVWTIDSETRTSSSGAYVLSSNRAGELKVTCEVVKDGVTYRGSNWALNSDNEQTQNVNIVVGRKSTNGKVHGIVRDRDGFVLENVAVWAYNGAGSAKRDFTNSNGEYELEDMPANLTYEISAVARTYRSDSENITIGNNANVNLDFVLGNPGVPGFNPPTNLDAVTWVSPKDAGRGVSPDDAYDVIKGLYDPRYKQDLKQQKPSTRAPQRALYDDRIVETDLFWDIVQHQDLLGYGIYRAPGVTNFVNPYDFMPDPLSSYYVDIGPNVSSTYSYGVTALATLYPDLPNTESGLSNIVSVETLDLLDLNTVLFGPLRFRWFAGSGADEYYIFLFDSFPNYGVEPVWDNLADPAFGTSYTYSGPPLISNRTYYFLVLGVANGGSSRTISRIGSFQT